MPLPWKRTKISRIVADLQPPSRAASLVVETGFPTAVVDLFVKNRDRLKRHSGLSKKTKHKHFTPLHVSESLAPPPTPSLTPNLSPRLPAYETVVVAARLDDFHQKSTAAHVEFDDVVAAPPNDGKNNANANANANENSNANANANADSNSNSTMFVIATKMFLAVIPVLSSKNLALEITLSAFLLFVIGISGKFVVGFLNSSSIRNNDQFLTTSTAVAEGRREEDQEAEIKCGSNKEIEIEEWNYSEEEELGEAYCEGEIEKQNNNGKGLNCCSELGMESMEIDHEEGKLPMGKNERSRSSKLRSKIIKKLIPKKLRSGKRSKLRKQMEKMDKMKLEEEEGEEGEEEEEEEEAGIVNIVEDEQISTDQSSSDDEELAHDQENNGDQIWEPEEDEDEEEEVGTSSTMRKSQEEEEKKNLECKFVMLIILLGLCGTPFLALLLTVSGSFIFKFIKFLNHKYKFG